MFPLNIYMVQLVICIFAFYTIFKILFCAFLLKITLKSKLKEKVYGEYGNTGCAVSTLRLQNPINFYLNPPRIFYEACFYSCNKITTT